MRKKIQQEMMWTIIVTLSAAYILTIILICLSVRTLSYRNLEMETRYIAGALDAYGDSALEQLDEVEPSVFIRLTAPDGEVLYDSEGRNPAGGLYAGEEQNQEGGDPPEGGILGRRLYHVTTRLDNGNILETGKAVRSASYVAVKILPMMLVIMAAMLTAAYFLSKKQARELVAPINALELDNPLANDVYEELHPLLEHIDEQNRAKDRMVGIRQEFTANVSHELKTPLTSISGYAEIMKNGMVKAEDMGAFADRIYNETQRMISMVNDIIELSRLDEGAGAREKEVVDAREVAGEVLESLQPLAEQKNIHLELQGNYCPVWAVKSLLREMIVNVAENAIKYNRCGGRVVIWTGQGEEGPQVNVTDTGIGIAPEEIDRIFERFYRVDKSHTRDSGGSGLGLSIVKHAAEINGARIRVQSIPGQGTHVKMIFREP